MVVTWRFDNTNQCVIDDLHIKMSDRLCSLVTKRIPNHFMMNDFGLLVTAPPTTSTLFLPTTAKTIRRVL